MNTTVWKFPLSSVPTQKLALPAGAEILTVQVQDGLPKLWAFVDPENPILISRTIELLGTGSPVDYVLQRRKYIGTFQMLDGCFVYHVFEHII